MTSTLIFLIFSLDLDSSTTLKPSLSCSNFSSTSLSFTQDFSNTLTLNFLTLFSHSKTTSIKWNYKLRNWILEFWTWELVLQWRLMSEAAKRVAIYNRESSRASGQVVGLVSPTWWPTGLLFLQIFPCFMIKWEWMVLGANSVETWPEWRWWWWWR